VRGEFYISRKLSDRRQGEMKNKGPQKFQLERRKPGIINALMRSTYDLMKAQQHRSTP
jgi:hypothetical protein